MPGEAWRAEAPFAEHCARENARLAQENEMLRQSYVQLTAAAEGWIRLYELALNRANAAEAANAARNR